MDGRLVLMYKDLRRRLQALELARPEAKKKRGYCFIVDGQEIWTSKPDQGGKAYYFTVKPETSKVRITYGA